MCNAADKVKQLCLRKMREQDHVIAKAQADAHAGRIDRLERRQQCAWARARHQAYAEVLEELE